MSDDQSKTAPPADTTQPQAEERKLDVHDVEAQDGEDVKGGFWQFNQPPDGGGTKAGGGR